MRHVSTEELMNYTDGKTSEAERTTVGNHIATCSECNELSQEFKSLITRLENDATFEPPADVVQWGVSLFQPVQRPPAEGTFRRLIASLVFDTYDEPVQSGIRRVGAPPRQLLFRAG